MNGYALHMMKREQIGACIHIERFTLMPDGGRFTLAGGLARPHLDLTRVRLDYVKLG